jgi:hypothetical protein
VVEHLVYTERVGGSKPSPSTIHTMTYLELLEKLQKLSPEELIEKVVVEDSSGLCTLVKSFKCAEKDHNFLYTGEFYLQTDDHIVTKDFDI